ncbi:Ankyrin-2 [Paramyrothecium foliicola]|nr:Ankyrin-2 [Paramyrothecium foliicola]
MTASRLCQRDLLTRRAWNDDSVDGRGLVKALQVGRGLQRGANIEAVGRLGYTALGHAAANGDKAMVRLLLRHGASPNAVSAGCTQAPLNGAIRSGNHDVIQLLLAHGANPEATVGEQQMGPLHWAASYTKQPSICELLLAVGVDVDQEDSLRRRTPLMHAAEAGALDVCKFLLSKGADVNATAAGDNNKTPLMYATRSNDQGPEVVKLFLVHGAKIDAVDSWVGCTPFFWAIIHGSARSAELLHSRGASIECVEKKFGRTPLLYAVQEGPSSMFDLLLKLGANTEAVEDVDGATALIWAIRSKNVELCESFLDHGANVNVVSRDLKQTPLVVAAKLGFTAMVRLFLERGADTEPLDFTSRNALQWTIKNEHTEVQELLAKHSSEPRDA